MADNTTLNSGTGGDVIATDDIAGVKYQRVKVNFGADGVATDVSTSDPLPISDAGGSVTVDGTVTANAGTGTFTAGGVAAHDAAASGNPVLLGAYAKAAAPTDVSADGDAVRLWADLAGRLQVGDGGTTLSVDDGGGAITVDGTVTANLAAGTNNIGDVDVLTVPAPLNLTGGGVEASALRVTLANDSTGVLSVDDNGASLTVDNAALSVTGGGVEASALRVTIANDSTGVVSVDDNGGSITVDGTVAVSGTVTTAEASLLADNAAFTDGTSKVLPAGFIYDEVAGTALTENDAAAARINVNRAQVGVIEDGTTRGRYATVSASNALKVDGSAVTQPVSGTVTASNTAGDVAHDSADSGNPVKVGGKAANALPTAVANSDRANLLTDLWGRALVTSIDPAMQTSKSFNATTAQTGADVWDPASGKKIAVTSVIIGTYGTTSGRLILWFGDNADTTYSEGTDQALLKASFAPSTTSKPGLVMNFDPPVYCTTADRELHVTTDAALSVDIVVHGFEW